MRAVAFVLAAIALVALVGAHEEATGLDTGLVQPLEAEALIQMAAEPEEADEADEADEAAEEGKPLDDLKKGVDDADSVDEVKDTMKTSVESAMDQKKEDLVQKASAAADKVAEEEGKKRAEKEEEAKNEAQDKKLEYEKEQAKADAEGAKAETESATAALENADTKNQAATDTALAEEKAKIATANRIAAEEIAKTSAAQRVAAEEDAKKAAAAKVESVEEASASEKTPEELHAMEAKAFRQAAALKVQEGKALAKVAAMKSESTLKTEEAEAEVDSSKAADATAGAKEKLAQKVSEAKDALEAAKAEPFDKDALQKVVEMKSEVAKAKAEVEEDEEQEERATDKRSGVEKEMARNENKMEDLHHHEGSGFDGHAQHGERSVSMEDKNMMSDPETRKWSDKDIDYWANKKMKWRFDDPMNKNAVMAKIFQIKDMEAQTIVKMNSLNTRIGMDDKSVEAEMMGNGHTVVVDGELVKQNPEFHIQHTFQGQKGKDPYTDITARDPEIDDIRITTDAAVQDKIKSVKSSGEESAAEAVHARRPVRSFSDVVGDHEPSVSATSAGSIADLKKSIQQNKVTIGGDESSDEEDAVAESEPVKGTADAEMKAAENPGDELGDSQEDAEADASVQEIAERSEDEAETDDNDVAEALDEGDMDDGIDSE